MTLWQVACRAASRPKRKKANFAGWDRMPSTSNPLCFEHCRTNSYMERPGPTGADVSGAGVIIDFTLS